MVGGYSSSVIGLKFELVITGYHGFEPVADIGIRGIAIYFFGLHDRIVCTCQFLPPRLVLAIYGFWRWLEFSVLFFFF